MILPVVAVDVNENVLSGGRPASGAPASEITEPTPVRGTKAPLTRPPPVNIVTKPAVVPAPATQLSTPPACRVMMGPTWKPSLSRIVR